MNIIFSTLVENYKSMRSIHKILFWVAMLGFAVFDIGGLIAPFELNPLTFFGVAAMSISGAVFVIVLIIESSCVPIYNGAMLFATSASSFGGLMMVWIFTISIIIITQKFVGSTIVISPWLGLAAFLSVIFCCVVIPVRNYYLHKDQE